VAQNIGSASVAILPASEQCSDPDRRRNKRSEDSSDRRQNKNVVQLGQVGVEPTKAPEHFGADHDRRRVTERDAGCDAEPLAPENRLQQCSRRHGRPVA
jgi:hypothetical protein